MVINECVNCAAQKWSVFVWIKAFLLLTSSSLDRSNTAAATPSSAHIFGTHEHFVDFEHNGLKHSYVIEGDLNIGAIFPIHRHGSQGACGTQLRESGVVQYVEALSYAIKQINQDPTLLPNLSLGIVVLDDCDTAETSLGQSLQFMPLQSIRPQKSCLDQCSRGTDEFTFFDVIGVIGSEGSDASMMIANVLKLFHLPQISPWATSDLLSDKSRYPFFMRTVPPDRFQVEAILHVILHFNWTYISAIYSEGGYGESAYEQFIVLLEKERNICFGNAMSVSPNEPASKYRRVIKTLYDSKVLVVVLFTDQEEARALLQAAKALSLVSKFVWIGSDGLGLNIDDFDGLEDVASGALTLRAYSVPVPGFKQYFDAIDPFKTTNPWFKEMWSELFKCAMPDTQNAKNYRHPCSRDKHITNSPDYTPEAYVSTVIDTVYVFAYALDKYITEQCRGVGAASIRDCINGTLLLQYLRNVTLPGHNGIITFDQHGDVLGKYEIHNYQRLSSGRYVNKRVGIFDSSTQMLHINQSDIVWNVNRGVSRVAAAATADNNNPDHRPQQQQQQHHPKQQQQQYYNNIRHDVVPVSQCGEICKLGEIYSYFRGTCCWECRACNKNEITENNFTKCKPCPLYEWPNENGTACALLPPYHMTWAEPAAAVLVAISALGTAACTVLFVVFVRHNDNRLIKATSRELSYIMLGGVTIQYVLLLSISAPPTHFGCYFNYTGFNVSFSVVYAPLLTRTNRIYRIFRAGRRTKVVPRFTSPLSQVVIALSLVAVQVVINVVVIVSSPPEVTRRMPAVTEPHAELACGLPVHGFVTSMSYNFLLILVCTFYAFKTRSLPDNFNESRYITLSVYTTLVIWMTFMPTYFTNKHTFHQIVLLACALILNASVILLCLFAPKVYAIFAAANATQSPHGFKFTMRPPMSSTGGGLQELTDVDNGGVAGTSSSASLTLQPTAAIGGGGGAGGARAIRMMRVDGDQTEMSEVNVNEDSPEEMVSVLEKSS